MGPSPSSTSSSRAPRGSDDGTASRGLATSGGNSRAPQHRGLTLHLLPARCPPSLPAPPPRVGAGEGYRRARPPAHRNSRRARPGSRDLAFRRRRAPPRVAGRTPAVPVGGEIESLIPTQHGGGVWGGFPRRRRLRGREEEALLHTESRPTAPPPHARNLRLRCRGR